MLEIEKWLLNQLGQIAKDSCNRFPRAEYSAWQQRAEISQETIRLLF